MILKRKPLYKRLWNHFKHHDYHWKWKLCVALPIFITVLGIDILTKQLALHYLSPPPSKRIMWISGFLGWQLTFNSGIAFGVQIGGTLQIIIAVAIILIAFFYICYSSSWVVFAFAAMIAAGACGNLLDRIRNSGKVVDFIYWDLTKPNTIFNMADFFIILGIICLVLGLFCQFFVEYLRSRKADKDETKKSDHEPHVIDSVIINENDVKV